VLEDLASRLRAYATDTISGIKHELSAKGTLIVAKAIEDARDVMGDEAKAPSDERVRHLCMRVVTSSSNRSRWLCS
jgi:hypothetical protein